MIIAQFIPIKKTGMVYQLYAINYDRPVKIGGLKEDGFLGKKTQNAIYNALVGTLTNQNTTQTTTVAPQPVKSETGTASPSDDK